MLETTLVMVESYLVTKVEPFEEGVAENDVINADPSGKVTILEVVSIIHLCEAYKN